MTPRRRAPTASRGALLALLLAACAHRGGEPTLRARGLTPAVSTADALRAAVAPRRLAVLVGIDAYEDPALPSLRHAGTDARAVAEVLDAHTADFDVVTVLTGEDTTRAAILDALRNLRAGLRPEDSVFVYFAGHGTRDRVGEGMHRFLLPSDARREAVVATGIDLEELLDWLTTLPAERRGLVVDACFDGGGRSVSRAGDVPLAPPRRDLRLATLGPGDIQVYATTPGRPSLEDDTLGHGVYTWFLLEALGWAFRDADRDGDRQLTLWEAHDHARARVLEHTGGAQVPEALLRTVGEADLVLRGAPGGPRPSDQALLYLYTDPEDGLAGASLRIDGRTRGALPGTHPVRPGRHRVEVLDADGRRVAAGSTRLEAGRAYRVDRLVDRLEKGAGHVGVRLVYAGAPGLERAWGPGALGVELGAHARVMDGPVEGLTGGGHLGTASTLIAPRAVDAPRPDRSRPLVWLGGTVGWQGDLRRWRLHGGLSATVWWAPAQRPDPEFPAWMQPDVAASVLPAIGPFADVGHVLSDVWTLDLGVRVEGTSVRSRPNAGLRFVPVVTGGLGATAAW